MKIKFTILTGCMIIALVFSFSCNREIPQPLYEPSAGPFFKISKSGKVQAQIIVSAESTYLEDFAASELQKYFEKISGVQLPIIKEGDSGKYPFSFFLGNTKKAAEARIQPNEEKMGRDGFELKSIKKGLVIQGINDLGTVFGVYELLERYFDVRWFMPGEEYYPRNTTLKIGQINLIYKPSFTVRWVGRDEWALRHRMNSYVNAGGRDVGIIWKWGYHTYGRLLPPEKYYADHPEYFSLVNGKRMVFTDPRYQGNQLCTTNPDVIREVARNLIDTLDANPDIEIISLSPDDNRRFCECENCRALDEPGRDFFGERSNRFAIFHDEVAKIVKRERPNVFIKLGAYEMYLRPPLSEDYKPSDNQIIQVCHLWGGCHNHPLGSDMCKAGETYEPKDKFLPNQEFEKILDQWLELSPHVFIYEYYTIGGMSRANLPWPLVHTIRTDIPFYRDKGVEGFYTQLSDDLFYRHGLNYYLAAKLTWNADLNVDALLNDYFEKFYGPAAVPAKDYFMTMEKSMQDWNKCVSYGIQGVSGLKVVGPKIFTPSVMERMEQSLASSERLSTDDETVSRRVAMIRKMFDETEEALKKIELEE